jgi:Rps23 Pro-64 3,4-dihydroxylase Tpa1-like proline 4-hydroxylase
MQESYYDRRLREKAEAAAAEKKKQERAAHFKAQQLPEIRKQQARQQAEQQVQQQQWTAWFHSCFMRELYNDPSGAEGLYSAIGHNLARMGRETREKVRAELAPQITARKEENAELRAQVKELQSKLSFFEQWLTSGRKDTEVTGGAQIAEEQNSARGRKSAGAEVDGDGTAIHGARRAACRPAFCADS